ncbi:substrate-binding domain-containing protein [Agreia sp. PsM10]|uniref:substrate-binding domain-containing protein n=1 Tax=Agreia sp. PsM10 TaxID=3030533 RepID=UPI00263BA5D7|nr:substrate-binding domain-containing protein [Agreia sp. PsM10]MDN4640535.1 substrate-binding domain-containing protein [Agreia sp. PsM10]
MIPLRSVVAVATVTGVDRNSTVGTGRDRDVLRGRQVAPDASAVGRIAAELLFRRITGDTSPVQRVQLATRLVPRGSAERRGPFVAR